MARYLMLLSPEVGPATVPRTRKASESQTSEAGKSAEYVFRYAYAHVYAYTATLLYRFLSKHSDQLLESLRCHGLAAGA
jgi:hypothetical protein